MAIKFESETCGDYNAFIESILKKIETSKNLYKIIINEKTVNNEIDNVIIDIVRED